MMIPMWAFIVACIVFLGSIIHAYIKMYKLDFINKELSHIVNCYIDEYGKLTWEKRKRKFGE